MSRLIPYRQGICIPRHIGLGDPHNPLAVQVSKLAPPRFVHSSSILGGDGGTKETLQRMRKWWLHDAPYLRKFTGRLVAGLVDNERCAVKDFLCESRKVYDWVKTNVRWTRDIREHETVQSPVMTLENRFGDCDCLTSLLNAMYNSIGYETMAVAGDLRPDTNEFSHVWSRVNVPSLGWVSVDPSDPRARFGWESPKGTRRMTINDDGQIAVVPL